jgi:peptidoglycan hydrolase CwlO-like protein
MVKEFLIKNIKTIFYALTWGFLVYVILFGGNNKKDEAYKEKLSNIEKGIQDIEKSQKQINNQIGVFNSEMEKIQNRITELDGEKTVIKEIYYEKINNVSKYSDKQLDSFFTDRYGLYTK